MLNQVYTSVTIFLKMISGHPDYFALAAPPLLIAGVLSILSGRLHCGTRPMPIVREPGKQIHLYAKQMIF